MSSRQLAAIMFADIMGYTALMQEDEEKALQLRKKFNLTLEAETNAHKGRVQKWMGDGALCIFNSTIEAVKAGVATQLIMQQEPKVPLRIGIHAGDVIVDGTDVYGDGVNLASRIESFAVPGSIFISGKVQDDIKNHKEIQTVSVGRFHLKNVKEPIEIFALSNPGIVLPQKELLKGKGAALSANPLFTKKRSVIFLSGIIVLAILLYVLMKQDKPMDTKEKSIAILPFRNESLAREENEFFCNGMMESVLNNLAQVKALHVISRQSVEQYRNSKKTIPQIADELGVKYILEGSVQRFANELKISAQLINADDDRNVWSQEYASEVSNLFSLQGEIAKKIASELHISISTAEQNRLNRVPTQNLAAWAEYQKAYSSYIRFAFKAERNDADYQRINSLCDQALQLDPLIAEAYTLKAKAYWAKFYTRIVLRANDELLTTNSIDTVMSLCRRALTIDKASADANTLLGKCFFNKGQNDSAIVYLETAIAVNPNHAEAHSLRGDLYLSLAKNADAFLQYQKVIKLDPQSVWTPFYYNNLAWVYLEIGDLKKSELYFHKTLQWEKNSLATVEAFTNLAHVYTVEGNEKKIIETARQWLQIDSTALRTFGEYYYMFKKDYSKSLAYFRQLFRFKPTVSHSKMRYAHALWLSGQRDTAMILFKEQLKEFESQVRFKNSQTAGAFDYDIAGIYAVLGQKEKAYFHLRRFAQTGWVWGSLYLIDHDPFFDSIRNEKMFKEMVQNGLKGKEQQRKEVQKLELL
jgi:TolB-like protein/Tfp pilus assembly protein PilF